MDKIIKIAKKHKLKIIEDSCETMFAKYKGKPVGSFGDYACLSTYAAHTLVTGVGGFILTNNHQLAVVAKSLVNHGRDGIYITIDDDRNKKNKELFNIVNRRFLFTDVGYSYRATEFEGAFVLAQMNDLRNLIRARKKNAAYLTAGLKDLQKFIQLPQIRPDSEHIFMFYPLVIIDDSINRTDLIYFLENHKIETRYLLPLLNQPIYQKLFGNIEDEYPTAKHLAHNGFYIGSHPGLTRTQMDYVIEKFHEFFEKKKSG